MINCIIIEDQLPAQRILIKYIEMVPELNLIGTYSNVIIAEAALKAESIDLIFLDIHLPKISGIEFLRTLESPPNTILTTAFSEYALEGYELNVVDYFLKPFSFDRFKKGVDKAFEKIRLEKTGTITQATTLYIKSGHEHFKIDSSDVLFINSDADYTDVHTSERTYISAESLKYWEERLSEFEFLRVHKSYIVNTKKILKTSARNIVVEGNHEIPIGRTYKNKVLSALSLQ